MVEWWNGGMVEWWNGGMVEGCRDGTRIAEGDVSWLCWHGAVG
jgi:hypothetical protein